MARLSTHVLDTAHGQPAAGVRIELHRIDSAGRQFVTSAVTNADGRTEKPLLEADRIEPGVYQLTFRTADYLRSKGVDLSDPPFLSEVIVRVGLADPLGNYHVPLLLSPYGYTTYRGS